MRALSWVRAVVGLGTLAAFLATAAPMTLDLSASFVGWGRERYRQDAVTARGAVFGYAYVRSVEEIRRRIPEDSAYFLVSAASRQDEGAIYWVRYDLAPRRAILLGKLGRLKRPQLRYVRRHPLDWAVVTYPSGAPPRLLSRQELLDEMIRRLGP